MPALTLAADQKFCFLCNTSQPRQDFYSSRTGSQCLSVTCYRHMSREEANRREHHACEQLCRAGLHPLSPLVPTLE